MTLRKSLVLLPDNNLIFTLSTFLLEFTDKAIDYCPWRRYNENYSENYMWVIFLVIIRALLLILTRYTRFHNIFEYPIHYINSYSLRPYLFQHMSNIIHQNNEKRAVAMCALKSGIPSSWRLSQSALSRRFVVFYHSLLTGKVVPYCFQETMYVIW